MRIRWKNIYWPAGQWIDENGVRVQPSQENFYATHEGRKIIVHRVPQTSPPSHGEASMTDTVPFYLYADTLEAFVPKLNPTETYSEVGYIEYDGPFEALT